MESALARWRRLRRSMGLVAGGCTEKTMNRSRAQEAAGGRRRRKRKEKKRKGKEKKRKEKKRKEKKEKI